MKSWSGGKGRSRGLARRSRRRRARMARRMRGRSGARRQHRADAAPQTPARRGRRKAPERRRRYERTIRAVATITRESAADFRKQGRGRSESAWTAKRQGVKAIWRLPNPRDARRNMRFRKSLDRRKSDVPAPHTAHTRLARTLTLPDARPPSPAGVGVLPCTGVWVPLYRGFIFPCAGAQGEQTRQQERKKK